MRVLTAMKAIKWIAGSFVALLTITVFLGLEGFLPDPPPKSPEQLVDRAQATMPTPVTAANPEPAQTEYMIVNGGPGDSALIWDSAEAMALGKALADSGELSAHPEEGIPLVACSATSLTLVEVPDFVASDDAHEVRIASGPSKGCRGVMRRSDLTDLRSAIAAH
jgi:hypothetical protein